MVSLRERAIKAAKEYEERKEKNEREAAKKFVAEVKKEFEETFNEVVYNVEPISENEARIDIGNTGIFSIIAIKKSKDVIMYRDLYPVETLEGRKSSAERALELLTKTLEIIEEERGE